MSDPGPKFSYAFNVVVRRHRLARNLSQETLSEQAEVDRTYVGLLERGQRSAGLDVAHRLADALGVPFIDLVAEAEAEWKQTRPPSKRRNSRTADAGKTAKNEGAQGAQRPLSRARQP